MDPLSQIIALLKPQAVFWRVVEAHDDWTLRFLPNEVVVFGQMIEGSAHIERDDGVRLDTATGDFLFMAVPPPWPMSGGTGGQPIDFASALDDPDVLLTGRAGAKVTRFIAGNFEFAPANVDLVASLMLPVIHVRGSDTVASRLGALLSAVGDEALGDRPGRSLVQDRLLEVLLIEALRYRPAAINGSDRGLLAGLADPKVGQALRIMHANARNAMNLFWLRPANWRRLKGGTL